MSSMHKAALALHAAFVVVCRGAIFFPVCIDVAGHLSEVNGGRSSSQLLLGPAILVACLHIAMVLDAIKDAQRSSDKDQNTLVEHCNKISTIFDEFQ